MTLSFPDVFGKPATQPSRAPRRGQWSRPWGKCAARAAPIPALARRASPDEQRRLNQWYLEEYLVYPWGPFRARAAEAEGLMQRLGVELFDAVFGRADTGALYSRNVAGDLSNTRIVIHAVHAEGIALPWELMHDPQLSPHGNLARLAHVFVRALRGPADRPSGPLTAEHRLLLLDTWQRSGLPASDFAALVGMSKHTL